MPLVHNITDDNRLPDLYEADYQRWLFENAALLRQGRFSRIDAVNIAEELEDMGRSETRALGSHLTVLQLHLLKWQFQPERRGSSWRSSIYNARCAIADLLDDSPSLRNRLPDLVAKRYRRARNNAANETGFPETRFPEDCPYSIADLLADEYWPD